jgi:hypothetical protein
MTNRRLFFSLFSNPYKKEILHDASDSDTGTLSTKSSGRERKPTKAAEEAAGAAKKKR